MTNPKTEGRPNGANREAATPQRQKSAPHPRYTLKQAEELARTTFDMGARRCDQERVARGVGYKGVDNGSFKSLRAAANHFELTIAEGDRYISVTEPWIQVFNSENPQPLKQARQDAMLKPDLYRQLMDDYADKMLPSPEKLARELHLSQRYGILREAADAAAKTFLDSAQYAGLVDVKGFLRRPSRDDDVPDQSSQDEPRSPAYTGATTRLTSSVAPRSAAPPTAPVFEDQGALGEDLTRMEVLLLNGKKAYFFLPQPLPYGERERLKKYIDLVLEEPPPPPASRDRAAESSESSEHL